MPLADTPPLYPKGPGRVKVAGPRPIPRRPPPPDVPTPMPRPPDALKRLLLPAWNGGHRLVWRLGEYLDAARHGRFEHCSVCGFSGPMLYRRWAIPAELERRWGLSPRMAEALARKETSDCWRCGAKLRARRLAKALLDELPLGTPPARSIAAWIREPKVQPLRIAEINRVDGLHDQLSRLPLLSFSEYFEGVEPGTIVQGARCEDLTQLTYPDASIDLILTSETLEHVPDLAAALSEIRRVLVPGGRHLFTVPILPNVPQTYSRAVIGPDGAMVHRATPIFHPAGDAGYPVFTEFGADLPDILEASGLRDPVEIRPDHRRRPGAGFRVPEAGGLRDCTALCCTAASRIMGGLRSIPPGPPPRGGMTGPRIPHDIRPAAPQTRGPDPPRRRRRRAPAGLRGGRDAEPGRRRRAATARRCARAGGGGHAGRRQGQGARPRRGWLLRRGGEGAHEDRLRLLDRLAVEADHRHGAHVAGGRGEGEARRPRLQIPAGVRRHLGGHRAATTTTCF